MLLWAYVTGVSILVLVTIATIDRRLGIRIDELEACIRHNSKRVHENQALSNDRFDAVWDAFGAQAELRTIQDAATTDAKLPRRTGRAKQRRKDA